jgi:hypothetical protein
LSTNSNDNRRGVSIPNEPTPVSQTTATVTPTPTPTPTPPPTQPPPTTTTPASSSSSSLTVAPPPPSTTTKQTIGITVTTSGVSAQISSTESSTLSGDVQKQQQQQPPSQLCPSCGRKAYIYLCSQIASSAKEFKRDIPSEDADTSLGIFLHYFLENHIHNLHYGVRLRWNFCCSFEENDLCSFVDKTANLIAFFFFSRSNPMPVYILLVMKVSIQTLNCVNM